MSGHEDATNILLELRKALAAMPGPDTVPVRLEMHPATLLRIQRFDADRFQAVMAYRRAVGLPVVDPAPWPGVSLPVVVDARLARFAVRATYASGRQELLILPDPPAAGAAPRATPPDAGT